MELSHEIADLKPPAKHQGVPDSGGKHKLFVYGTLKIGQSNHYAHLHGSKYLGTGWIDDVLMFCMGSFPGCVDMPGFHVHGEVWEVDDIALQRCDQLEGHPGFYHREKYPVTSHGMAWIYLLPDSYVTTRVPAPSHWYPRGQWFPWNHTLRAPWTNLSDAYADPAAKTFEKCTEDMGYVVQQKRDNVAAFKPRIIGPPAVILPKIEVPVIPVEIPGPGFEDA